MQVGLFSGDALTDAVSMLEQVKASPGMLGANLSAQVSTDEPYVVPAVGEPVHRGGGRPGYQAHDADADGPARHDRSRRPVGLQLRADPRAQPGRLFFSNGPGDPATADHAVGIARSALADALPTFGICFGNQILGRALGFDTYKLAYGHRGINQPVQDRSTGRSRSPHTITDSR